MNKRRKSKIKRVFWWPFGGGLVLWYCLFASVAWKIAIPWVLAAIIYVAWKWNRRGKKEDGTKKVRRYT